MRHAMRRLAIITICACAAWTSAASANELVPTGTLRATYIGTNPVQAFVDPATKEVRGPAAELARALAQKLKRAASTSRARRASPA